MELRVGYKQTDLGSLPVDWDVKVLTDLCWFQEGPGLRHWQFTTNGMKVLNVTNIDQSVLNLDWTDRHIALSEFNRMYQHFAVAAGDMVMASSGNSYSKTAKVRPQDLPLMMNTSVIRFKPSKCVAYEFLWAFINSWIFKDQIDLMITGGAQPNFGPYHLKRILVPTPPLPEQQAIAAALADVDSLITALDNLIAKKHDLNTAAMQELLTGKQRLPGFSKTWKSRSFDKLFQFLKTANNSRADLSASGDVGYIHYGDIHTTQSAFLNCDQVELPRIVQSKVGDIPVMWLWQMHPKTMEELANPSRY